jgi:hypothetical protein
MFWALFGCGKKPDAVVCVVNYGGEARRLEFPATESPYTVKTVDVAQRFAFKAIYLREARQRDVISVYTYQQTSAGPRLLHEAKYKASLLAASGVAHGFTGRQLVYSSDERELEYFCQLSP